MSTTFYDNTSPLPGVGNSIGINPGFLAASFSTDNQDYTIAAVKLVVLRGAGAGNIKLNVDLYASIGTSPNVAMGALIANLATNATIAVANATPILFDIPLAAFPALARNTRFWIVLTDPTNSGVSLRYTSPWDSTGTGVVNEFNSGAGGFIPPDANPADFFSNNQLSTDPNGRSAPYYMFVSGNPAVTAKLHFRVLTSASLSPGSNNDLDWTLGTVQL